MLDAVDNYMDNLKQSVLEKNFLTNLWVKYVKLLSSNINFNETLIDNHIII